MPGSGWGQCATPPIKASRPPRVPAPLRSGGAGRPGPLPWPRVSFLGRLGAWTPPFPPKFVLVRVSIRRCRVSESADETQDFDDSCVNAATTSGHRAALGDAVTGELGLRRSSPPGITSSNAHHMMGRDPVRPGAQARSRTKRSISALSLWSSGERQPRAEWSLALRECAHDAKGGRGAGSCAVQRGLRRLGSLPGNFAQVDGGASDDGLRVLFSEVPHRALVGG